MGILDDAIREHLELKRQHGVPEEELRRQEEEALGPARRDVAPAESTEGEATAEPELHDQETVLQEPDAAPAASPPAAEEAAVFDGAADVSPIEADVAETGVAGEESAEAEVAESGAAEPDTAGAEIAEDRFAESGTAEAELADQFAADEAAEADLADDKRPSEEPIDEVLPDETSREAPGDTLPSGFERLDEDELVEEEGEPDEDEADVLEDTPDFLQETPEHDRLWFEQKPPRDFDFD